MIQDIHINKLPVGIVTDSHTHLDNLEKLKEKYEQIICLGDFTSVRKPTGSANNDSVTAFRESGIPCLRGNHEEYIHKLKTATIPLPFAFDISKKNLDFIGGLPVGFRLILPNGLTTLCFHNRPNSLGGHGGNPQDIADLWYDYPIDETTSSVITGHNHLGIIRGYKGFDVKFVRCASLKDGGYAEIDEKGLVRLRNLHNTLENEEWWQKYCDIVDAQIVSETVYPDLGDYPYYDEKEGKLISPY